MIKQKVPRDRYAGALIIGIVGAVGLLLAGTAMAQADTSPGQKKTGEDSGGFFHETIEYLSDNSYLSLGPHYLHYTGSSGPLVIQNATGLAAQAFGPGREVLEGTGATVGDKFFVGGTLGIFIPGTNHHWAIEVLLAPPLELTFKLTGRAVDESLAPKTKTGIPTGVPAIGRKVGTLKALPPNLTFVYRPWTNTLFQPYIGVGAAYLFTYEIEVTNEVLTANNNEPSLKLSEPVACIAQVGMDVQLPRSFYLNVDLRYLGCAEIKSTLTDVEIYSPKLSPTFGPVDVGKISTTVNFEALIYSFTVGWRF